MAVFKRHILLEKEAGGRSAQIRAARNSRPGMREWLGLDQSPVTFSIGLFSLGVHPPTALLVDEITEHIRECLLDDNHCAHNITRRAFAAQVIRLLSLRSNECFFSLGSKPPKPIASNLPYLTPVKLRKRSSPATAGFPRPK